MCFYGNNKLPEIFVLIRTNISMMLGNLQCVDPRAPRAHLYSCLNLSLQTNGGPEVPLNFVVLCLFEAAPRIPHYQTSSMPWKEKKSDGEQFFSVTHISKKMSHHNEFISFIRGHHSYHCQNP